MNKNLILTAFLFSMVLGVQAQQAKLFVSLDGGSSSLFTLGKVAYDSYYYTSTSPDCDTLICSGKGLILPEVGKQGETLNESQKTTYSAFNKAIKKTIRKVDKEKAKSGAFVYTLNDEVVTVNYRWSESGVLTMELVQELHST